MFVGLYIFLGVRHPIQLRTLRHGYFQAFGYGAPLLNTLLWVGLSLATEEEGTECSLLKHRYSYITQVNLRN